MVPKLFELLKFYYSYKLVMSVFSFLKHCVNKQNWSIISRLLIYFSQKGMEGGWAWDADLKKGLMTYDNAASYVSLS